jgi:hypothetical protein
MLYKYMKNKYVDSMLDKGALRIGTLKYYKNVETHGDAIGDGREGQVRTAQIFDDHTLKNGDKLASKWGFGGNGKLVNCIGVNELVSDNCYIYSMSRKLSSFVAQSFECEASIEIFDVIKFADNVTEALVKLGLIENSYIVSPIFYSHRPGADGLTDEIPSLIKRNKYEYQDEVRIVWPLSKPIKVDHVDIEIGSIRSYAKKVNISNDNFSNNDGSIFKNILVNGATIRLTNPVFHSCKFDNCNFVIDSLLDCHFEGANFEECTFKVSSSVEEGIATILKMAEIPMFAEVFQEKLRKIEKILKQKRSCAGHFRNL